MNVRTASAFPLTRMCRCSGMITKPAIRTPLPMLVEAAYHVSTDALFHKEWQELHYADRAEVAVVVQIDVPVPAIAHVFLAAGIKRFSLSLAATAAYPLLSCVRPLQNRHSRSIENRIKHPPATTPQVIHRERESDTKDLLGNGSCGFYSGVRTQSSIPRQTAGSCNGGYWKPSCGKSSSNSSFSQR